MPIDLVIEDREGGSSSKQGGVSSPTPPSLTENHSEARSPHDVSSNDKHFVLLVYEISSPFLFYQGNSAGRKSQIYPLFFRPSLTSRLFYFVGLQSCNPCIK